MRLGARLARLDGRVAVEDGVRQILRRFPPVFVDAGVRLAAVAFNPAFHNAVQQLFDPGPIDGGGFVSVGVGSHIGALLRGQDDDDDSESVTK